jgi:putative ABC transport system permease protein
MALGARPGHALGLVLRHGALLVMGGLALGSACAWGLGRLLAGTLYRVSPGDPATFAAVAIVLGAVALLACALPARRAARIEPQTALKGD